MGTAPIELWSAYEADPDDRSGLAFVARALARGEADLATWVAIEGLAPDALSAAWRAARLSTLGVIGGLLDPLGALRGLVQTVAATGRMSARLELELVAWTMAPFTCDDFHRAYDFLSAAR